MSSDIQKHLSTQLSEAQSKYIYFLLAAAASAITLVVQRTTGCCLNWNMLPLGVAVLCWAISFYAGCQNRLKFNSTLSANILFLNAYYNFPENISTSAKEDSDDLRKIQELVEGESYKAKCWADRQFKYLVAGAIFFLMWHIIEMSKADIGSILFHLLDSKI
jgi:hypothetical protein